MMFRLRPFSLYRIYATGSDSPLAAVYSHSSRPPCMFDFFLYVSLIILIGLKVRCHFVHDSKGWRNQRTSLIWKVRDKLREVKQ